MSDIKAVLPETVEDVWRSSKPDYLREAKLASIMARAEESVPGIIEALPDMMPASMLDIGAGLAAKTVLLARHYTSIKRIHLLDGDGATGSHTGGYHKFTYAWANVWHGFAFACANLPHDVVIAAHTSEAPAKRQDILIDRLRAEIDPVDLIISWRAWGHHFAVSMYAQFAFDLLTPGGICILDIRNNTNGEQHMEDIGFKLLTQVPDKSTKCRRLAFRKPTHEDQIAVPPGRQPSTFGEGAPS